MSHLFSDAGRQRLAQVVKPGILCAFDFDGTLAPIVADPDRVRLPDEARGLLETLSRHAPVAIITGRSIDDILPKLGFTPDFLVGNHGLEGVPGWEAQAEQHMADSSRWRKALEEALDDGDLGEGIVIEDKKYSLSVHYRAAPDQAIAARRLPELFSALEPPPRIVSGKLIYSLMPKHGGNKGSALEQLMRVAGAGSALYVGDDVTDEDVFRLHRSDVLSVRVEQHADTAADFFLPHLDDMTTLLRELISRLQSQGAVKQIQSPVHTA